MGTRGEQTRERILAIGHDCIRRVGIRRMAMEAVAEEAGLSRAALYRYFPNKQSLVDAVLEHNARRFRKELSALVEAEDRLAEKVAVAARFGHFPPQELLLLGLSQTDPVSLAALLTTGAHQFLERATRFWEPHVAQAQAAGELPGDVATLQAAEWIARSLFAMATAPPTTLDTGEPAELERYASTFIVGGLLGVERPSSQR